MVVDGVRLNWSVSLSRVRRERELICTYAVTDDMIDCYMVPLFEDEGVRQRVEEVIGQLIKFGAFREERRELLVSLSRALFENWGYRWETVS